MLPIERFSRWWTVRKTKCRNCGGQIPEGRSGYCSDECHDDFNDWMAM